MNDKNDILDTLIAIAIILFILSVIVEKITQLIRRYSPFIKSRSKSNSKLSITSYWRNIKGNQTGTAQQDKVVEREVTSLSFVIGSLLAIAFKVDLFEMIISKDPRDVLFWKDKNICAYWHSHTMTEMVSFLASVLLTGFFLSFGSKFFHDLLDNLLLIKNLKRKLVDDVTYKVDSVEQLDTYLNEKYSDIIKKAIDQNRNVLIVPEIVGSPLHGRMKKEGKLIDCIDIRLSGSSRGKLPFTVPVALDHGKTVHVLVNAIFDVETPKIFIAQGETIANKDTANFKGTLCCKIMRDQKEYLVTCSHVYTGGTPENNFGNVKSKPTMINDQPQGNFVWAMCTEAFDLALIDMQSATFNYDIQPNKPRKPVASDILQTHVRIPCRNNVVKKGVIVNDRTFEPIEIQYKSGKHSLSNLIVLSNVSYTNDDISYSGVTIPGDSGACVYDEDDKPIGMIVAGDNKFSYAIPMVDILNQLTAEII